MSAFEYLMTDSSFATGSKEMSQAELDMISEVADLHSPAGLKFWATCLTVQCLSEWGVSTSIWFHSCSCKHSEKKDRDTCRLKGRRSVELACGAWKGFIADLKSLTLSRRALDALEALQALGQESRDYAHWLTTCFTDCKADMEFRSVQAWSFWDTMPFSILEMAQHFVSETTGEDQSRRRARELMSDFDRSEHKTSMGYVSWYFFGDELNRSHMVRWIHGQQLHVQLQQLLQGYACSLVVMQRLESRHHLVNQALTRGRAGHPSSVIANLRRTLNGDVQDRQFRQELPNLLNRFTELVPDQWSSRKHLLELVYGFGLDSLHPDLSFEELQLAKHAEVSEQQLPPVSIGRTATCLKNKQLVFSLLFYLVLFKGATVSQGNYSV